MDVTLDIKPTAVPVPGNPVPHETYDGLQALRFVAALMVMIAHSTFYASERLGAHGSVWLQGAAGVNVFFAISGFVMVVSTRHGLHRANLWRLFLARRVIRIVPMYWLATTLKLIVLLALPGLVLHARLNIWNVVSSYLFIPTTNVDGEVKPLLAVGWTLYFEMYFYILFAIGLQMRGAAYYFIGVVLVSVSLLSLLRQPSWMPWAMFVDPIVLNFLYGMAVAGLVSIYPRVPALLAAALLAAGFFLLLTSFAPAWFSLLPFEGFIPGMIVLGVVWLEPTLKGRIPIIILLLGEASYVLYLFHPLIAPVVPEILRKLGVAQFTVSVLLSILVALTVGLAVHLLIEKRVTLAANKLRARVMPN
jgi:Predicted acyltransferases